MTVTEDRTDALLETDHQEPVPEDGSVLDILQLLEEAASDMRAYADLVKSLRTPVGVVTYLRRLSTVEQQIVLTESGAADQHALEVAHARSEVLQQVCAQVLSRDIPLEMARELLGPMWREPLSSASDLQVGLVSWRDYAPGITRAAR